MGDHSPVDPVLKSAIVRAITGKKVKAVPKQSPPIALPNVQGDNSLLTSCFVSSYPGKRAINVVDLVLGKTNMPGVLIHLDVVVVTIAPGGFEVTKTSWVDDPFIIVAQPAINKIANKQIVHNIFFIFHLPFFIHFTYFNREVKRNREIC